MSDLRALGMRFAHRESTSRPNLSFVLHQRPLSRVLAFTGRSIDDVVNNPIVKNEVLGYYKLHRFVQRRCDITDLEKQWNPLG